MHAKAQHPITSLGRHPPLLATGRHRPATKARRSRMAMGMGGDPCRAFRFHRWLSRPAALCAARQRRLSPSQSTRGAIARRGSTASSLRAQSLRVQPATSLRRFLMPGGTHMPMGSYLLQLRVGLRVRCRTSALSRSCSRASRLTARQRTDRVAFCRASRIPAQAQSQIRTRRQYSSEAVD